MNIVIRRKAADDLEGIFAWIAEDDPSGARVVIRRLRDRIARLATPGLEHMGRPGLIEKTRELIEPPYINHRLNGRRKSPAGRDRRCFSCCAKSGQADAVTIPDA